MDVTAADLLEGYNNPSLQQMARARGINLKGKSQTKPAMIAALAPSLYDAAAVTEALADLAPVERRLLDRLILLGGEAPTDLVRAPLEAEGHVDPRAKPSVRSYENDRGSPWARGSRKFPDVVARLGVLGLVFTLDSQYGTRVDLAVPNQRLFIPDAILRQLPAVTLPPETTAPPPVEQPAAPAALLRDVYLLLSLAQEAPLPLIARGTISKRTLVRLDELLHQPEGAASARSEDDLSRLPLLRALAEGLGLLVAEPDALVLGAPAAEFLRRPAGERLAQLFAAYRATTRWCELPRLPGLGPVRGEERAAAPLGRTRPSLRPAQGGAGRWASARVVQARQRVLAEVAELPAGEWIALGHLIDRLRQRAYEFLYPRQWPDRRYGLYSQLNAYAYGNAVGWALDVTLDDGAGWNLIEAGFVRVVVSQALHALGVVDLGWADDQLTAFRVTPDGARLLRGEPLPEVTAAPHVVVQPNFQIFAFEPTGEDVLFGLDELAERVRAEHAVEYRLTRESVYAAQRRGRATAEILAFLEQVSRTPLPQNVRRSLEEWGAQHERIVVRRGVPLLQAADAATLDALYAEPALAPLLGRRVAPTACLVAPTDLAALHAALLERDRLPALTEGADDLASPQIAVAGDGRIVPRQRVPNVYVLHALRDVADAAPDGTLQLGADSLRRAARTGAEADSIIILLEQFQGSPLDAAAAALVRQWAKDWGQGALVPATLLQVERAELLAALLADPALRAYLQTLPGADTLALVHPEGVATVRAALEARGMALAPHLLP